MPRTAAALPTLESRIEEIAKEVGGEGLAVSFYDYETGLQWSQRGDRWFHSASTIKVAVLLALFGARRRQRGSRRDRQDDEDWRPCAAHDRDEQ